MDAIEQLRKEVNELRERVAVLEKNQITFRPQPPQPNLVPSIVPYTAPGTVPFKWPTHYEVTAAAGTSQDWRLTSQNKG